jgi:hypothetical protein
MTKIIPRDGKSNPVRRHVFLAIAAISALFATQSECFAYDGPAFRGGLWKFERTLETDGKPTDRLQTSGLLIDRAATRCVNPTDALKAEFTPFQVGACNTKNLQKTDEGYVFQRVCGEAAPIKTEISVKNDSAYTEVNQGNIGKISTKETIVAHRVGDCHPPT